jgi:glyoxylase-like metal-dependent hydrolase (beta-lactamase superfamily II)
MTDIDIIVEGIYLIGGPNISRAEDATSFIIDFQSKLVMVDCGAGQSAQTLEMNIRSVGLDPAKISALILTHCHIDHIGAAPYFRNRFGCKILVHELDAEAVEQGNPIRTAANWYGIHFPPTPVDNRLIGEEETLQCKGGILHWLHTPGHTPGSISIYIDRLGKRVLFGQDIHGPFNKSFGSDINQWKHSMAKLIALEADILCEGHFGIFNGKDRVRRYIERYLEEYD